MKTSHVGNVSITEGSLCRLARLGLLLTWATNAGCVSARAPRDRVDRTVDEATVFEVAAELDAMSQGLTKAHRDTFRSILEGTLAQDPYVCLPRPRELFFGDPPEGERTIRGFMPHYGFFFGPMRYRVHRRRRALGEGGRWEIFVTIAVVPPPLEGALELPDCTLVNEVHGDRSRCRGIPYAASGSLEACPASGSFSLAATQANVRALLVYWSREVERYYNRDSAYFGLPIHYDFEFVLDVEARQGSFDFSVPLSPSCGRTPYFTSFRSGWSLPIVAHEIGHVLGLLDEYEALSGIFSFYPKTPFPGAEVSRMGLSMREGTRVLPLHHYLILRRYVCPEPSRAGFFDNAPLR